MKKGSYDEIDPSDGVLEYGFITKEIPTTVYRGRGEPMVSTRSWTGYVVSSLFSADAMAQEVSGDGSFVTGSYDEKWIDLKGTIVVGGVPVVVATTVRSGYRDVSEGLGKRYEYSLDIVNSGDAGLLVWPPIEIVLKLAGNENPSSSLDMKGKDFAFSTSVESNLPPAERHDQLYFISKEMGKEVFGTVATAYIPAD